MAKKKDNDQQPQQFPTPEDAVFYMRQLITEAIHSMPKEDFDAAVEKLRDIYSNQEQLGTRIRVDCLLDNKLSQHYAAARLCSNNSKNDQDFVNSVFEFGLVIINHIYKAAFVDSAMVRRLEAGPEDE